MENWYQVLHISQQATEAEIKAAYRKLAKENHPDAHPGDADCAERFAKASEAYHVLSDPDRRKAYDEALCKGSKGGKSGQNTGPERRRERPASDVDFQNINQTFERFFGFNPSSKEVVDESKLNRKSSPKNPLDASDIFDKFMGIKR